MYKSSTVIIMGSIAATSFVAGMLSAPTPSAIPTLDGTRSAPVVGPVSVDDAHTERLGPIEDFRACAQRAARQGIDSQAYVCAHHICGRSDVRSVRVSAHYADVRLRTQPDQDITVYTSHPKTSNPPTTCHLRAEPRGGWCILPEYLPKGQERVYVVPPSPFPIEMACAYTSRR